MKAAGLLFIAIFCLLIVPLEGSNQKSYWIVFGGHKPRDPVYLTKVSADGSILVAPRVVLKAKHFGSESGAAAIAHFGESKLHLWRWGKDRKLYHGVIDKQRIKLEHIQRLDNLATTDSDTLQVTQRPDNQFLIFESSHSQLMGIALDPLGLPKGDPWKVIKGVSRQNDEACLSSDGEMVASNRHDASAPSDKNDRIFAAQLKKNGRISGASQQIAGAQDIEACDVSNDSKAGTRMLAYIIDHGTDPEDILVLQRVSSDANAVGRTTTLYADRGRNQDDQNVALDPHRKFVVFTVDGEDFGCEGRDVLVHLRLGAKGKPLGTTTLLAGCDLVSGSIVNIDILQD
jgi:hypothetical protein